MRHQLKIITGHSESIDMIKQFIVYYGKKARILDDYQWKVVSMLQETELEKVF